MPEKIPELDYTVESKIFCSRCGWSGNVEFYNFSFDKDDLSDIYFVYDCCYCNEEFDSTEPPNDRFIPTAKAIWSKHRANVEICEKCWDEWNEQDEREELSRTNGASTLCQGFRYLEKLDPFREGLSVPKCPKNKFKEV